MCFTNSLRYFNSGHNIIGLFCGRQNCYKLDMGLEGKLPWLFAKYHKLLLVKLEYWNGEFILKYSCSRFSCCKRRTAVEGNVTFKNRLNFMSYSWRVRGIKSGNIGIIQGNVRKDRLLADEGIGVKNIHAVRSYEPLYNELHL